MVQNLNELNKRGRIIGRANYIFTPEIASSIGSIHGSSFDQDETIVIGRDYHNDSRMLKRGYTSGVMSTGVDILNLSDCTYPLLQFTIRRFGASGGVYFSGGHLYSEDVGIRFVDAGGIEFERTEIQKLIDSYNSYPSQVRRVEPSKIGLITAIPQTQDVYVKSLQQFVDNKAIRNANLKVVIDCSYGPTGKITPLLLNDIGAEFIALNTHYRERSEIPVPSVNTIRNTADIVKASNSHLGVCFDVDGSRILILDENGLEVSYEDLLMLFVTYEEKIKSSRSMPIITTPSISQIVIEYLEDAGHPVKQFENYPGEISRQLREHRACFGAADTLKFYFPQYAPFSDGNFILLKLLEIMTKEDDLLSSLIRGFPQGIKVNKSLPVPSRVIEKIHNKLIEFAESNNFRYHDIINEVKIMDDDVYMTIKVALNRDSLLLSSEAKDPEKSKEMVENISKLVTNLSD